MLPAEVLALLRQWWKARPTAYNVGGTPEQRWLFPGRRDQPLTTRQFGRLFKEAAKAAALRKTVSLHSLRHSFATQSFERHPASMRGNRASPTGVRAFRNIPTSLGAATTWNLSRVSSNEGPSVGVLRT